MKRWLHITSLPPGEAPLWVREGWVGLSVPLAQSKTSPLSLLTSGVLSGPKSFLARLAALVSGKLARKAGYLVEVPPAIDALATKNPAAARWWRENTPHLVRPRRYFVFPQEVGHVTEEHTA